MHFLVIDDRFRAPVFVFLELDPRWPGPAPDLPVRSVTLDLTGAAPARGAAGVRPEAVIGQDPDQSDRFREFPSDGAARAAGFAPVEPRYVGSTWESYLRGFRPHGRGKPAAPSPIRGRRDRAKTAGVPDTVRPIVPCAVKGGSMLTPLMESAAHTPGELDGESLRARIGSHVLDALGRPGGLHAVQVRWLWQGAFRVNVLVGRDADAVTVAHSFFLEADADGGIVSSTPPLARLY